MIIWAFFAPLAALFFVDLRAAGRWMLVFLFLLVCQAWLAGRARPMPQWLNTLYFLMNLGPGFSLIALVLYYFVKDREQAYLLLQHSQAHIEQLLLTDDLTRGATAAVSTSVCRRSWRGSGVMARHCRSL